MHMDLMEILDKAKEERYPSELISKLEELCEEWTKYEEEEGITQEEESYGKPVDEIEEDEEYEKPYNKMSKDEIEKKHPGLFIAIGVGKRKK